MPLRERSIDALLAEECTFLVPSREALFAEAARLLRASGRLALCNVVPSRLGLLRSRVLAFALER